MTATPRISVIEDPRFRNHVGPDGHPEAPARLLAVGEALTAFERQAPGIVAHGAPRQASDEEILRIHTEEHLRHIEAAVRQAPARLDADTYISHDSFEVARLAAGSCVDLAIEVAKGDSGCGFAALRPPGHHAESDRAMGFCLFNGVAIAARALQQELGIEKVLILDWDVHHGNGSQHSFADDPSILYVSTHQFPFYPGTGAASEAGSGMGSGATVNIPMPAGCGDYEYIGVLQHLFAPIALEFDPDFILVSCGFDAHHADPLGSMEITDAGYLAMTRIVREVAETACNGRIAYILEGGYSAQGLAEGTASVLAGMSQGGVHPLTGHPLEIPAGSNLEQIVKDVRQVHYANYGCISEP